MTTAPLIPPSALASLCTDRQRHETRESARVEANAKTRANGRRHKVEGCGICNGFHTFTVTSPAKEQRRNKKANRRRGWVPTAMGA